MTPLASTSARGGLVTVGAQGITVVTRIVVLITLARLLSPEVFGLVAIVQTISILASSFVRMGLGMAGAQATRLSQNANSVMFYVQALLGLLATAVMFALSGPIAGVYGKPSMVLILQWMSLIPLIAGLQSQYRIILMRALRFTGLAVSDVLSLWLGAVVAIAMASVGYTYLAVISQLVLQPAAQLAMLVMMTRWHPSFRVRWDGEIRHLTRVGIHIMIMNTMKNVSRSAMVPLMGLSLSPGVLGQFDRAQQLSIAPLSVVVNQLQRVAVPVLSRIREQPARLLAYLRRAQLLTTYLVGTGMLLIAALCPDLVVLVLGQDWHLAGVVLAVLCGGAAFRVFGQAMNWVFISTEATQQGMRLSFWTQPAVVLISLIGLPWGVIGVAIANSVAWFLYWPIACVVAGNAAHIDPWALPKDACRVTGTFSLPVAAVAFAIHRSLISYASALSLVAAVAGACVCAALLMLGVRRIRKDVSQVGETLRLAIRRPA